MVLELVVEEKVCVKLLYEKLVLVIDEVSDTDVWVLLVVLVVAVLV